MSTSSAENAQALTIHPPQNKTAQRYTAKPVTRREQGSGMSYYCTSEIILKAVILRLNRHLV